MIIAASERETRMARNSRILISVFVALLLTTGPYPAVAAPAMATGPAALALAAVVAEHTPLGSFEKRVMRRLFNGDTGLGTNLTGKISVEAASVICRVSNVDITARSCDLTFRTNKRTLRGREANELYATMVAAGVASEGAAGSIVESVSKLACTIDPREIRQRAGRGADCTFETGQ
jgi:hypothetical protein